MRLVEIASTHVGVQLSKGQFEADRSQGRDRIQLDQRGRFGGKVLLHRNSTRGRYVLEGRNVSGMHPPILRQVALHA